MAQRVSNVPDGFMRTVGLNEHRKCTTCGVKVVSDAAAKPINAEAVGYVSTATHECGDGGDARIAGNPAAGSRNGARKEPEATDGLRRD